MKIKRFTAPSIRTALDQVRAEQGPDAVILSSQQTDNGVEVVAATDYDEALLHQMKAKRAAPSEARAASLPMNIDTPVFRPESTHTVEESVASEYHSLRREFGSLRTLVQSQMSQLSWSNLSQDKPEQAALVRSLTGIGLTGDIVASLAKDLDAINDPVNAWREALALFAKRIPLASEDVVSTGGIFAFVGSTGVGKTTTIAKLATRFVMQHGSEELGLISYDPHSMAAPDQLLRAGGILGVPVQQARGTADLRDTLSQLDSKRLVLIDTPGRSPRDPDFDTPIAGLIDPANRIRTILTLAGNAQGGFQRETVERYRHLDLEGVAIAKLDETTNLGELLSLLMREKLKIGYVTEGQELNSGVRSTHDYRAGIASRAVSLAKRFREPTPDLTNVERTQVQPILARA